MLAAFALVSMVLSRRARRRQSVLR
jgi:hypothetical protein